MPDNSFESLHDAGMYVSRETIRPLRVEPLRSLPDEIREAGVALRLCHSLAPLAGAIVKRRCISR